MKRDTGLFPFALSRAELHWLAGAFGIAFLPLPDDAPAGLSPFQLESIQKNGHASLLTRGLIRPSPGFGWQVERLPAALVQWIASAQFLLRLENIPKEGTVRRAHFFTSGNQGLSLEMDGDTAHFTIYESLSLLQVAALHWLSVPAKSKATPYSYFIPQPLTLIPAAWKDPQLAARILEERSIEQKIAKSTLEWISSLEWVAMLSKVKLDGTRNTVAIQYALCGDKKSMWGGEDDRQKVSYIHIAKKAINAKIVEML